MSKKSRNRKIKGASIFVGLEDQESQDLVPAQLIKYSADFFAENETFSKDQLDQLDHSQYINWLNLHAISDIPFIASIGKKYQLENLTLDKIIDLNQRPKMEEFQDYMYLSLKTLWIEKGEIETEQISFIVGRGFLLSFQEEDADLFDEVRERLRKNKGIVRSKRSGYLLYLLLDAITENYRKALDELHAKVDRLNTKVVHDEDEDSLPKIEMLKQQFAQVKRNLVPLRDVVTSLHNGDSEILLPETVRYIGNVKDQLSGIIEEVDFERTILDGLVNIHLTNLNNRMNEVMKVLTVIATIFIPLTFIAGIYGMNFENMPELGWEYGYPMVWGVMFILLIGMLIYFRRQKWF